MAEGIRVPREKLTDWVVRLFENADIARADAEVCAEILVIADVRGIESHGVARLPYYLNKLKDGSINANPKPRILHEMPAVALFHGDDGMGPVVGKQAMELAIKKAKETGAGMVSVTHSNHYGIAGYYSMMALEAGMIGISMTNSLSLVAPTFGTQAMLGTNPLSVAAPAGEEPPYVLDMATSTVPAGKIEIALREQNEIPSGWLIDKDGKPTGKPLAMLQGGTLTPLGSDRERSNHKGYGLSLMVDLLSAILSGANYGARQEGLTKPNPSGKPSNVGHFFGAMLIEGFRPLAEFKDNMDEALRALKGSATAEGQDRIYVAGEPEFDATEDSNKNGVPLSAVVTATLTRVGDESGVPFDLG